LKNWRLVWVSGVHSDATPRRDQAKRETKTRAHRESPREKIFHFDPSTTFEPFINSFSTDNADRFTTHPAEESSIA
jgi:hypothetical protein